MVLMFQEAGKKEVGDATGMVMEAYNHIVQPRQPCRTAIVFDIQSDWAEFNLLSPESIIIPDTVNSFPVKTVASNTRVKWGEENSYNLQRQTLRFYVVNDGSPIDFSISHGSDGAKPKQGRAAAIIGRANYLNEGITDDVWNTVWFYQKPVSTPVASTRLELARTVHSWDTTLKEYLKETGASGS